MDFSNIAALTIVSKNYISLARVLCDSFLNEHPGATFFVVLVDDLEDEFEPDNEKFTLLNIDSIGLPSPDVFIYQYNVLELNTAAKPFALKHILSSFDFIEKVAYIDPDIYIYRSLNKVWESLDNHSVVLTPHMREPFYDDQSPNEVGILQSGTYNLGFIALCKGESANKLLNWWMQKLYLDCVVDIPNGLFVDQKWMDLVPAYFEDAYILHDPSFNIAYWNLHERELTKKGEIYYVDEIPLSFFHFSGYCPLEPNKMSKHQTRHELDDNQLWQEVFDNYGDELITAEYEKTKKYHYAYSKLPNGIELNDAIYIIIRHCLANNISFPSPHFESDLFCDFLLTPNVMLYGYEVAPLLHGILLSRPDVKGAYPEAWYGDANGLISWCKNSGIDELDLSNLIENHWHNLKSRNSVSLISDIYFRRSDVHQAFPNLHPQSESLDSFLDWLEQHGKTEEHLTEKDIKEFKDAFLGFYKCLILYLIRPDINLAFPDLAANPSLYYDWLKKNVRNTSNLNLSEIEIFLLFSKVNQSLLESIILRYSQTFRDKLGAPLNHWNKRDAVIIAKKFFGFRDGMAIDKYLEKEGELESLEAYYESSLSLNKIISHAFNDKKSLEALANKVIGVLSMKTFFKSPFFSSKLKSKINKYSPLSNGINVAGYFNSATGMGQSARSMIKTLESADIEYTARTLPNVFIDNSVDYDLSSGKFLGGIDTANRVNLIVANADSIEQIIDYEPKHFSYDRFNVGYWVWETEELPRRYSKAASFFDEIWTPSEYSANAIRKCVSVPVRVVPHIIDFKEIDEVIKSDCSRTQFNLPDETLLYGYFFDQKSILERKNPKAVIDAFRAAFKNLDVDAALVLKVNSPSLGHYDYEVLKSESSDLNIIWIEETLTRQKTLQLMNCLDVYVSLHRSEGFGLTIAEAMAMGKPVIASNYSGNLNFMDEGMFGLVDTNLIKTRKRYGPYPKNTLWGDPDVQCAARIMIELISRDKRDKIGSVCRSMALANLNSERVAKIIKELINTHEDSGLHEVV